MLPLRFLNRRVRVLEIQLVTHIASLLLSILFNNSTPVLANAKTDSTNSCKNRVQSGDALDIDGWEVYMDRLDGRIAPKSKEALDQ